MVLENLWSRKDLLGFYILLLEMGSGRDDGQGTKRTRKSTKYRMSKD